MTIVLDGSSGITAPGGTAAAPSITTTGDVNTGIFFPAADTIAFSEGGVESMRIDSSANVGIGTATPGAKLDVNVGGTNNIKLGTASSFGIISLNGSVTTSASMGIFGGATGDVDLYYQNATGGGHRFRVSTTTMAYLDSSGNLGLGVTPSVWGSNRKAIQFGALGCVFSDNNVTSEIGANVYISTAPAYTYITSNFATRYAQINGQHQWHTAASGTAGNAITFTQAMTLDASGNLGIGTTAPANRLHVVGASATPSIRIGSSIVLGAYWDIGRENATSGDFLFMNGSTERARITGGGDFGIGTSSPTTGSLSNNAGLSAGIFSTSRGTVASTSGVAVTIGTAYSGVNVTYIVSCGLSAADPTNYSAVSVVSADNNVLRATALQSAALMSISVSGTSIRATQSSGVSTTLYFTLTRVS